MDSDALAGFTARTRAWFASSFDAPTPAQEQAWQAVRRGENTLVVAPTGSGKTLAAFLWAVDRLVDEAPPDDPAHRCRVVYVSPLKALAVDVERNLRAPLAGIRRVGGADAGTDVRVAVRSGDTPAADRRAFSRTPPDILITTPESLYLLLTSRARESLAGVQAVIVDEVHAVAGTKRGAHLALSLERLDELLFRPAQRIGLSATVRPVEEVARFLGGPRDVTVVQAPSETAIDVTISVPVEDMTEIGQPTGDLSGAAAGAPARASIWPAVEERVVDLVESHRSTIVFANSRRLAERLCERLNALASERAGAAVEIARAHHGSVAREERVRIEDELKSGRLPCVVATSSLELGIDMGAVDLVVQVGPPPSVASGLQRVGRAGHQVGATSVGVVFPKHRGELPAAAVTAERMRSGSIEALRYPRSPLDVLAQQVVAMVAMDDWQVDDLARVVRRAAPFAGLPQSALDAVLDMLSGRYPSDEFAELRPRLNWDRVTDTLTARPGAQRLAVTSGGTIPDRGLYGVFLTGEHGGRVGELDEEMVYESRVGDVFTLGASSWRIEDITHDRVLVSPAPGQPGKLPFWHGDAPGRPVELGRAIGAFVGELGRLGSGARERLLAGGLDAWAADNLLGYLAEQREATGALPDDRTVVVERFRDELGDWRVAVHTPFGAPVHAPWALALAAQLRRQTGVDVHTMHTDDGIMLRLPETDQPPPAGLALLDPDEVDELVRTELSGSPMFASRFRECAARSLLLPRRTPGRRTPLWQQRQRSAQLLGIAGRYGSFPVVLEAMRECLQDVFDVPGLVELMRDARARRLRVVEVDTPLPSPFARSLLFGYVGVFMYDSDAPLAERRAQTLSLDTALLAELLGEADLRDILDPDAIDEVSLAVGGRALPQPPTLDDLADLLRTCGDMTTDELTGRGATPRALAELEDKRRAIRVRVAGAERWAAVEDAARLRDALGVPLPPGLPDALLEPVADPLGDLVGRYARTHGPFHTDDVARRFGLGPAVAEQALHALARQGRLTRGRFRTGEAGEQWCDTTVLGRIRRRSLARLRAEVEPVPARTLARFLPDWQGVGAASGHGADGVLHAVEQLQGATVPASQLEQLVLASRVTGYAPALLDELCAAGEVVWAGHGSLPGGDGWVALYPADSAAVLLPDADPRAVASPLHEQVLDALSSGGALFYRDLQQRTGTATDRDLTAALWDLVWGGWVTNDTPAPLRAAVRVPGTAPKPRPVLRGGRRVGRVRPSAPGTAGRWSALPDRERDPTRRRTALAEALLHRHGVLTRGAVQAEQVPGGFSAVYPVLKAFEESGRARRGYFVESLGAAQFAQLDAVDRMRAAGARASGSLVLAATDPAQPYGAALPWPERSEAQPAGHRPGRKPGAVVVLVDGAPVLYVERGGRSLLSWPGEDGTGARLLQQAADALSLAVRDGALGRLTVERADGDPVTGSMLGSALRDAGFSVTPRGLRLRS